MHHMLTRNSPHKYISQGQKIPRYTCARGPKQGTSHSTVHKNKTRAASMGPCDDFPPLWFFQTGFLYVTLAVLELTTYTKLALYLEIQLVSVP